MVAVLKQQGKLLLLSLPFLILLLIDLITEHIVLILAIISMLIIYERFNDMVVHQYIVQENSAKEIQRRLSDKFLKERQSWMKLCGMITFSAFLAYLILVSPLVQPYWAIDKSFFGDTAEESGFWNQLVSVVMMDYIFKFLILSIKCVFLILGKLHRKKRSGETWLLGPTFFTIEVVSQMLRCLAVTPQWVKYCIFTSHPTLLLRILCTAAYGVGKCFFLFYKFQLLLRIAEVFKPSKVFTLLSSAVIDGENCPVCLDLLTTNRVVVKCEAKHHMCLQCASIWFDRFGLCPICSKNFDTRQMYTPFIRNAASMEAKKPEKLLKITDPWRTGVTDSIVQMF